MKPVLRLKLTDKQTHFKPSIHSIMMGNVNELVNKMDELLVLLQTSCTKNANVDLPGFAGVRTNRSNKACRKSKSGGPIMDMNNQWWNPGHVSTATGC